MVLLQGREGVLCVQFPRGSGFQAAVGPSPAAASVWKRPEGQRWRSLWHWIICLSVILPAGRDAVVCVFMYVCVLEIWMILLQADLCFSRFKYSSAVCQHAASVRLKCWHSILVMSLQTYTAPQWERWSSVSSHRVCTGV